MSFIKNQQEQPGEDSLTNEISNHLDFRNPDQEVEEEHVQEPDQDPDQESDQEPDQNQEPDLEQEVETPPDYEYTPEYIDSLTNTIRALQEEVTNLKQRVPESPASNQPETPSFKSIIKERDFEDIMTSDEAFEAYIDEVIKDRFGALMESTTPQIAQRAQQMIQYQTQVQQMANQFYAKNADLKPHANVVGVVYDQLAKSRPDLPHQEILDLTANTARAMIRKKENEAKTAGRKPTTTIKPKGQVRGQSSKEKLTKDQAEILRLAGIGGSNVR